MTTGARYWYGQIRHHLSGSIMPKVPLSRYRHTNLLKLCGRWHRNPAQGSGRTLYACQNDRIHEEPLILSLPSPTTKKSTGMEERRLPLDCGRSQIAENLFRTNDVLETPSSSIERSLILRRKSGGYRHTSGVSAMICR